MPRNVILRPICDRVSALQEGTTASTAAFTMHHVWSRVAMPVTRQSLQAVGSSLRVLYVGAPLRALPHLDGRCAGAVPQEVTDVVLVDLYEADLHQGMAHAIRVVEGDCILTTFLLHL